MTLISPRQRMAAVVFVGRCDITWMNLCRGRVLCTLYILYEIKYYMTYGTYDMISYFLYYTHNIIYTIIRIMIIHYLLIVIVYDMHIS